MNTLSRVMSITLHNLKTAQKHFNENPSSINWGILTKSMLVYQQARQLSRQTNADTLPELLERLDALAPFDWAEAIVQNSLSMSIADALERHA